MSYYDNDRYSISDMFECMKRIEWEKAQAHLHSMLATFHGEKEAFEEFDRIITTFISDIESLL